MPGCSIQAVGFVTTDERENCTLDSAKEAVEKDYGDLIRVLFNICCLQLEINNSFV